MYDIIIVIIKIVLIYGYNLKKILIKHGHINFFQYFRIIHSSLKFDFHMLQNILHENTLPFPMVFEKLCSNSIIYLKV